MRALAVVLALAACGGKAAPTTASSPTEPTTGSAEPLRFDWAPPCRVPVTERTIKDGHEVVMTYSIDVNPLRDGEIAVEHVGYSVVSYDGTDLRGPQHAEEAAQVAELAALRPRIVIAPDGSFLRAEGMIEIIERVLADQPPEKREAVRDMMTSPRMLAMMADKYAEPWVIAVGAWTGLELEAGKSLVANEGTIQHLGVSDGLVHLRYTQRLEGKALVELLGPQLEGIFASFQATSPDHSFDYESFISTMEGFRDTMFEVVTDPATLRPRRSKSETRAKLQFEGMSPKEQREVHELEFDWDRAVGCGR